MLCKMIFAIEEVLSELLRDDINEQGLAPGFRFHPTDEELITFYLASKVYNGGFCGVNIAEVDLNRCEPWELPDKAKMGEREWYLFSLRDRKYPTGLRTNRATGAGYWKATGKDRQVYCASSGALLGMKKTLVFYKSRAPKGEKTMWVMHEYRLDGHFSTRHTCKEEEWVMCRIYHKTGEKKKPLFQGRQNYLLESAASYPTTNWFPQLLETQFQNPFVIFQNQQHQQENDIKSLINPALSQSQHLPMNALFQSSSFTPTRTKNTNNTTSTSSLSSSMLFKSLLSNQDYCINSIKEESTIPKVECKTKVNFSHFQIPSSDSSFQSMEKNQSNNTFQYQYQNQLLLPLDKMMMDYSGVFGESPTVCSANSDVTTVNDMSTSIAFNGFGFQMMLDPPSKLPRLSWPLDA